MAIYVNFKELEEAANNLKVIKGNFLTEVDNFDQITNETTLHDWKGSDANRFVATTKEKVNQLREEYDEFLTEINNEIQRNYQKFQNTQKKNLNILGE